MTTGLVSPKRCADSHGDRHNDGLKLHDLSLATRSGVRGVKASEWLIAQSLHQELKTHELQPPELQPNTLVELPGSRLLMALSTREFWLLEPETEAQASPIPSGHCAPGVWPLYNQNSHAWLVLSGEPRAEMMAKLCGVDLRLEAFPVGTVAQTQMALASVVIAHHLWRDEAVFSLFVDQSLADFAWEALQDAMEEFNSVQ